MRRYARFTLIGAALTLSALPLPAQKHWNEARGAQSGQSHDPNELDSVNLFNGNMTLALPVGQDYPVNGGLGYRLTLRYNSKVWDYEQLNLPGQPVQWGALPSRRSNAGLGWQLSLGALVPTGVDGNEHAYPVYRAPDGSEHAFYTELHPPPYAGTGSGYYTRNSSYLRIPALSGPVEFPNGDRHSFDGVGRLTQIKDRFNNTVNVTHGATT